MANQNSIDLRQKYSEIAERLLSYLHEMQGQSDGQSEDLRDWRSISKTIERMAVDLQNVARDTRCDSDKRARYHVLQLIELTNELDPWLTMHGEIFTVVTCRAAELVSIGNQIYNCAHHAAYCETRSLLKECGFNLGPVHWANDTFDPSGIIDDWDRARNVILDQLSESWEEDFVDVPIRIPHERAALEGAVWQVAPANPSGPAGLPGAPNQSANEQPVQKDALGSLEKGAGSSRRIRPTEKTVKVIDLIRRGKNYEEIHELTGNSIDNIRQIRSRLDKGMYIL